jgi:hypothetical protein
LAGKQVVTVRPPQEEEAITDTETVQEIVSVWMEALAKGLEPRLGVPSMWKDEAFSAYFTDKPAWDCFGSLLVWAAHLDHPEMERPGDFVERWFEEPAVVASNAEGFESQFSHLLRAGIEMWLPIDFPFTFDTVDVAGRQISFGSSPALRRQLARLNELTWRADEEVIRSWRKTCPEFQSPVEMGAKFAFEILWRLSKHAVEETLPMKLDY